MEALEERELLYAKTEMTDEEGMRLGELEGIVGDEDGYEAASEAAILLQGLDIPEALHDRTMAELQGGQKVRVLLAQALFGHPQALLLDEPTNHLDLDSIHWLREFLVRYEGTLIVISHDRHFLNAVCTHTADIDYQTIITYTGGYDDMVLAKMQIRSRVESENAQREKKIAQLQDFIARFSAGTRASQVMSRKKEVERLQTTDLARSNIAAAVHQVHDEPAVRPPRARGQRRQQGVRRPSRRHRLQRHRQSRREDRPHRPQRPRQDDDAEGAAVGCAEPAGVARRHRRGHAAVGPRSLGRLLRAGSYRRDQERA